MVGRFREVLLHKLKVSSGVALVPADQASEWGKCREWKCREELYGGQGRYKVNIHSRHNMGEEQAYI